MRNFKIILSVIFILVVSFFVVRSCAPRKRLPRPARPPVRLAERRRPAPTEQPAVKEVTPAPEAPRMAIILDDWGANESILKLAVDLHEPITLSVIPHLTWSQKIAAEAHSQGLGVMLHMPMEPKTRREGLEPHTIMTTTPDAEIVRYLDEAIQDVPYADGMNNHMGSAATCDWRVMRTVLARLKEKNLFFVDSKVIPASVGWRVAKEMGIEYACRDVFIDNQLASDAIKVQLRKAIRMARNRGKVVVIGHDHETTLRTIKEMLPEIEESGVRLVLVRELVKK
jgi:hypothetical protein